MDYEFSTQDTSNFNNETYYETSSRENMFEIDPSYTPSNITNEPMNSESNALSFCVDDDNSKAASQDVEDIVRVLETNNSVNNFSERYDLPKDIVRDNNEVMNNETTNLPEKPDECCGCSSDSWMCFAVFCDCFGL